MDTPEVLAAATLFKETGHIKVANLLIAKKKLYQVAGVSTLCTVHYVLHIFRQVGVIGGELYP